jgi:hypothetical protein
VNKLLLTKDMEVEIEYHVTGLGSINTIKTTGLFVIQEVLRDTEGKLFFIGASINDGVKKVISVAQICGLDGMDIARFAAVYGIASDGTPLRMGKRRGRVPKIRTTHIDKNNVIIGTNEDLTLDA